MQWNLMMFFWNTATQLKIHFGRQRPWDSLACAWTHSASSPTSSAKPASRKCSFAPVQVARWSSVAGTERASVQASRHSTQKILNFAACAKKKISTSRKEISTATPVITRATGGRRTSSAKESPNHSQENSRIWPSISRSSEQEFSPSAISPKTLFWLDDVIIV